MPGATTSSTLSIAQLQLCANDAQQTWKQLDSVLNALSVSEESAQWASEALENCGNPLPGSATTIVAQLSNPDQLIASWACKLLARMGAGAAAYETALVAALEGRTETLVREESARALGEIGQLSDTARNALTLAAKHGSPRLQRLAAASLGG